MDLFFHDKKTYIALASPDDIKEELRVIEDTAWYKLSRGNLSATLKRDDSFTIQTKFAIGFFWPSTLGSFVLLQGKIEEYKNQTFIHTTVRPNYLALVAFAVLVLMLIFQVFGINQPQKKNDGDPAWIVILVTIVLFGLSMFFCVRSLRRRFEKVFRLT
jgi:hypothetical protein